MKTSPSNVKLEVISEEHFFRYWESKRVIQDIAPKKVMGYFKSFIQTIPRTAFGEYYWQIFDNAKPYPRIISVGGSVEKLTPLTPDELLQADYKEFFKIFHPADLEQTFTFISRAYNILFGLDESARKNMNICIYTRIKNYQNVYHWNCLQYPALNFDEDGNFLFGMALYTNVNHLMKSAVQPMMTILDSTNQRCQLFKCIDAKAMSEESRLYPVVTRREREIISLLSQGKASKQIGHILGIQKNTVDNHRQRLLKKFGVRSSAELVFKALTLE